MHWRRQATTIRAPSSGKAVCQGNNFLHLVEVDEALLNGKAEEVELGKMKPLHNVMACRLAMVAFTSAGGSCRRVLPANKVLNRQWHSNPQQKRLCFRSIYDILSEAESAHLVASGVGGALRSLIAVVLTLYQHTHRISVPSMVCWSSASPGPVSRANAPSG